MRPMFTVTPARNPFSRSMCRQVPQQPHDRAAPLLRLDAGVRRLALHAQLSPTPPSCAR
jgi:hypothetical protein